MKFDFDAMFSEVKNETLPAKEELLSSGHIPKEDAVLIKDDVQEFPVIPEEKSSIKEVPGKEEEVLQKEELRVRMELNEAKEQTVARKRKNEADKCQIRDFPRSLMHMVKLSFPDAPNSKALAAFVYANRDTEADIDYSDVSDEVIELAKKVDRFKKVLDTEKNIRKINEGMRRINEMGDDLMLALSYLIYDRAGFRIGNPSRPSEIDFLEPGVQEVANKIERTSDTLRKEKQYREGRPRPKERRNEEKQPWMQ